MFNETEFVMLAAGGCSLATSPGGSDNWIEKTGSGGRGGKLPNYICRIARAIMRSGKSRSTAISIAISRTKAWAAGRGDVDADTRAKAAAAVAQWEALKAKNKAKKTVKATTPQGEEYVMLSDVGAFNTDLVRRAWDKIQERRIDDGAHKGAVEVPTNKRYYSIRELWTDHLLVADGWSDDPERNYFRVPYTVLGGEVTFGAPKVLQMEFVESDDALTPEENELLRDILDSSS